MVFDTPLVQILILYVDFEGAKNIHVLEVLIWGFGGCWRFLTGVWHLDHDLNELRNLVCIFPEFFISLRLVKAKIDVFVEAQFSSEKLCQGWPGGWDIAKLGIAQLRLWRTLEVP